MERRIVSVSVTHKGLNQLAGSALLADGVAAKRIFFLMRGLFSNSSVGILRRRARLANTPERDAPL